MASLAFLLSPRRDIPDSHDERWMALVCSWLSVASRRWFELWKELPEDQQRSVPKMPPGAGLSNNAMDASLKKDPQIIESARPWAERAWSDWNVSGRKTPVPVLDAGVAHEALQLDSRISLAELTGYSGGFVAIPAAKLKRGGRHAFLKNEGDPNAFALGEGESVERELLLEVARGHGGDHVAVWTFGHALHALVARSPEPGARPVVHGPFSVRTRVANGTTRNGGFVEAMATALAGSAFTPDFDALQR